MSTETKSTLELIRLFVNQESGLDFNDYGDRKIYDNERLEIRRDLFDFKELMDFALNRIENLEGKLTEYLSKSSGRLTLENGKLQYCTGQYFPTEYRPAVNRVLVNLIWADYRDELKADGSPVYPDGNELRKAIRQNFGRRINNNYFN